MSLFLTDRASISGTRRTGDGYLAADARVARTGIQTYAGAEVGRPQMSSVRIYRSPEEVFSKDALASLAHKPITVDHPADNVDATKWKGTAVGWTGESIARDGETIRVSMMVADASAIADISAGKRELSCGYTCDLDWTAGVTPNGEAYDAMQRSIRINHVAIVAAGRAGSSCRIGDSAGMTIMSDAERTFADSPEGRHHVALAKHAHDTREAHKGPNAKPFTDAMAAVAARSGAAARAGLPSPAAPINDAAALATARAAALAARKEQTRNAWMS